MQSKYTAEHLDWLRENYKVHSRKELMMLFNSKFNFDLTASQIKSLLARNKILSGRSGCFEKGHKTYNKGVTGIRRGIATEFKKGNRPHNIHPVGTELMATGKLKLLILQHGALSTS